MEEIFGLLQEIREKTNKENSPTKGLFEAIIAILEIQIENEVRPVFQKILENKSWFFPEELN